MNAVDDVKLVPEPTKEQLNERQLVDYRQHRTDMVQWMLHLGKDPDKAEGYALDTVRARAHRIDMYGLRTAQQVRRLGARKRPR